MGAAQRRRILVVEDDVEYGRILAEALESHDFEVEMALDGESGLTKVSSSKFDAILTDIKMPKVDGLSMISSIREQQQHQKIPIIIVSGFAGQEAKKRASELGVLDVLSKPTSADDIAELLTKKLSSGPNPDIYTEKVITCMRDSLSEVFEFYLENKPTFSKAEFKSGRVASGDMTGFITLTGKSMAGSLAFSLDKLTIKRFGAKILNDEDVTTSEEIMADLVGELANQVAGRVKINFSKDNIKLNIGLPQVTAGENHKIFHLEQQSAMAMKVEFEGGNSELEFCLSEVESSESDETDEEDHKEVSDMIMF